MVDSWAQYDEVVAGLPRYRWLFRGHAEASWAPETSLYRAFENSYKIKVETGRVRKFARAKHERYLVQRFKRSAHLYLRVVPDTQADPLEWLAVMQHHGAPTRLLDVTFSPSIAAYFAMEQGYGDSAVFAFDHTKLVPRGSNLEELRGRLFAKRDRSLEDSFVMSYSPKQTTDRLLAQQGAFLVPSELSESLTEVIQKQRAGKKCLKIVIPARLRYEGVARLREMNLTSTSLFPGIDGFCRSLRFQLLETVQMQARRP